MKLGLDLGLSMTGGASGPTAFTPLSLFASGEKGGWYDPSDLSTLFQNSNGTGAVSADGDPVGYIADKSGNGNHLIQATAANRPLYKTSGGLHWLQFDGTNDELAIASMAMGSATKCVFASSVKFADTAGFDGFAAAGADDGRFFIYHNGLLANSTLDAGASVPNPTFDNITSTTPKVLTHLFDFGGASVSAAVGMRVNGAAQTPASADGSAPSGTFADGPVSIGGAPPVGVWGAYNFYGGVFRFAATADPSALETYLGAKAGLTI